MDQPHPDEVEDAALSAIAKALPALRDIAHNADLLMWRAESLMAHGLLHALANLVDGESVPGSENETIAGEMTAWVDGQTP